MLKDLPRNTRLTLLLEPYSSVISCVLTFYAALYMQANGLGAGQIGLIATIAAVTGLACQFVAAPIVNRLGRRRTLFFFSLVCWSIPLLLWSAADGFVLFLLAAVIFSSSRIASVAWYCVATEDLGDDQKPRVFGLLQAIATVGGLGTLLAGPAIARFGLVPSMRVLYALACVSMTLMFAARHRLLTETRAGAELGGVHAGMSLAGSFRRNLDVVMLALKDAWFRRLVVAYVALGFAGGMGFVQTLYLNNVLKLSMAELSVLPPVAAVVSVLLFRYAVPRLGGTNERAVLLASLAALAAGMFLLLLVPEHGLGPVLAVSALLAGGGYLFGVCLNAAMNNRMGALHKAELFSAVQLLAALAAIPAGYIAGSIFEVSPQWSIAISGLVMAAAALWTWLPLPARSADAVAAPSPGASAGP